MAEINDFETSMKGVKGTGVSVRKMLETQKAGGGADEKLQAIAEMFVKAQEDVAKDQEKLSDKQLFATLNTLDRRFTDYANNIGELSVLLEKFTDPNYAMNKKEAQRMEDLLNSNSAIVKGIQDRASGDEVFRTELEGVQKNYDFLFRNKGLVDEEQSRLERRFNETSESLWTKIGDNISTLSTDVMSDLSENLIDGIGGPWMQVSRQVLLPLMKQIKDSPVGKAIGGALSKVGDRIKGMFGGGGDEASAGVDEVELSQDIGDVLGPDIEEAKDELIVPDQSDIRKRFIREQRIREPFEKGKSNQGVFRMMHQEAEKSSMLLGDILNTMRGTVAETEDMQEALVAVSAVNMDLAEKTDEEIKALNESSSMASEYLKDILSQDKMAGIREKVMQDLTKGMYEQQKEVWELEDDFRDQLLLYLAQVLEGLEDVASKAGSGGKGLLMSLLPLIAGGLFAGGIGLNQLAKKREERLRKEDEILIDKRLELAQKEGGVLGQRLEALIAEEQAFGGASGERYTELEQKAMSAQAVGGKPMSEEDLKELEELRRIIRERKKAETEVIKSLYGKGTTEEGNTIIEFTDLMGLEQIKSKGQLKELLEIGNISVRGKTKGMFGNIQEEVLDIDESMKGLARFGRAEGINIERTFRERVEAETGMTSWVTDWVNSNEQSKADAAAVSAQYDRLRGVQSTDIEGQAKGGVYPSESLIRIAEDGPEAVVPLDDYVVSAPGEDRSEMVEIAAIERDTAEIAASAMDGAAQGGGAQQQSRKGVMPPIGGRTTTNKVSLSEIPVITDNLGLILLNSGKIFT